MNKGNNKITELRTILQRESQIHKYERENTGATFKQLHSRTSVEMILSTQYYK
jgi:hypothetical protein